MLNYLVAKNIVLNAKKRMFENKKESIAIGLIIEFSYWLFACLVIAFTVYIFKKNTNILFILVPVLLIPFVNILELVLRDVCIKAFSGQHVTQPKKKDCFMKLLCSYLITFLILALVFFTLLTFFSDGLSKSVFFVLITGAILTSAVVVYCNLIVVTIIKNPVLIELYKVSSISFYIFFVEKFMCQFFTPFLFLGVYEQALEWHLVKELSTKNTGCLDERTRVFSAVQE